MRKVEEMLAEGVSYIIFCSEALLREEKRGAL
jgi:hypothetical protein